MGNNNLTKEELAQMDALLNKMGATTGHKTVKKNTGLIERANNSKVIITEDNRQILTD